MISYKNNFKMKNHIYNTTNFWKQTLKISNLTKGNEKKKNSTKHYKFNTASTKRIHFPPHASHSFHSTNSPYRFQRFRPRVHARRPESEQPNFPTQKNRLRNTKNGHNPNQKAQKHISGSPRAKAPQTS